jgi:ParB family chromosome partitioning protein
VRAARRGAGLDPRGRRPPRRRAARRVSNLLRLLDLPDEALALLEDGTLTEGHGRALLMAPDHADRRRLGPRRRRGRLVGARDRGPGPRPPTPPHAGPRGRRAIHPDQAAAAEIARRARRRARHRRQGPARGARLQGRAGARLADEALALRACRPRRAEPALSFRSAAGD